MNKAKQKRYQSLYRQHVNALHRQGKSKSTIDIYSRAFRRVTEYFDRCPDRLTTDDLKEHFTNLVNTHSWSTVKVDHNGLQFFYKHVLNKHWQWVYIVKPPIVKSLPDILTSNEISLMINATRETRYQTVQEQCLRLHNIATLDEARRALGCQFMSACPSCFWISRIFTFFQAQFNKSCRFETIWVR